MGQIISQTNYESSKRIRENEKRKRDSSDMPERNSSKKAKVESSKGSDTSNRSGSKHYDKAEQGVSKNVVITEESINTPKQIDSERLQCPGLLKYLQGKIIKKTL